MAGEADENLTREDRLIQEEWRTVIETQMHFNEMLMQVRTAAVTIVLAFFGAAAISLQFDSLFLKFGDTQFHAGALIIALGLGMLVGVFCLDYWYYYRMLLGAVKRGYEIDAAYANKIPGVKIFGMTSMIRDEVGDGKTNGRSRLLICVYYGVILALGVGFMLAVLLGHKPA